VAEGGTVPEDGCINWKRRCWCVRNAKANPEFNRNPILPVVYDQHMHACGVRRP